MTDEMRQCRLFSSSMLHELQSRTIASLYRAHSFRKCGNSTAVGCLVETNIMAKTNVGFRGKRLFSSLLTEEFLDDS